MKNLKLSSLLSFFVVCPLVVCGAKSMSAQVGRGSAGTRTFELQDTALGMDAATVHVPAGWGFAGVIVHANNCVMGGHSMQLNTESPDGMTGLLLIPALAGMGSTNAQQAAQARQQGCIVVTSEHAADYIKTVILPHLRPGARVISEGVEPLLEGQVQQIRAQAAQMRQNGPQGGMITMLPPVIESARVRISYMRNGHPEEEFISALTFCSVTRYNQMGYSELKCTADNISALHAPAGQLDALVGKMDAFKLDFHPQWNQKMMQVKQAEQQRFTQQLQQQNQQNQQRAQGQMNQTVNNINGAAERSQKAADAINQRGAAIRQVDRNRQDAIDHSAQATAQSMGDHNVYSNANGTQYSGLSNQYSHTYDNGQGTILQTNSAYAPGGGQVWTELTPKY